MKVKARNVLTGMLLLSGLLLNAQTPGGSKWVLTFSDEFEGRDLDFAKWAPHSAAPNLSTTFVPGAIGLMDGHARISAVRADGKYTSGAVSTYGTFGQMYGRFEVRMKAPAGRGLESRVRLLPVPSGEFPAIEMIRIAGTAAERALFGNAWGDEKTERGYSGDWKLSPSPDGFHVYAVEWDAQKIVWFIDGKERFRSGDGIPKQPMYIEVDLNIGGPDAKWPDATTTFPAVLELDYVRAWQRPL